MALWCFIVKDSIFFIEELVSKVSLSQIIDH